MSQKKRARINARIDRETAINVAKAAVEWNPDMMDEGQMLNLLLEIPRRDYQVKPPSSYIIDDRDVIVIIGKGCDLFNFLMFELITLLLASNGFFQISASKSTKFKSK
jgi:hypothetical protein